MITGLFDRKSEYRIRSVACLFYEVEISKNDLSTICFYRITNTRLYTNRVSISLYVAKINTQGLELLERGEHIAQLSHQNHLHA